MQIDIKNKLIEEYKKISCAYSTTAIKYFFKYKNVNVNIFFDAYDEENLNLSMILIYESNYYYTPLNINKLMYKEYLHGIPENILYQILSQHKKLDDFFEKLSLHINSKEPIIINYEKDKIFKNTIEWSKKNNRKDLPFLSGLRRVKMTEKTLKTLNETMGIEKEILEKIKNNNMTIVRTGNPLQRKKLTLVLKEKNID